jgi:uncharacterized membrane protein YphA (DoxX/SURF4 family)
VLLLSWLIVRFAAGSNFVDVRLGQALTPPQFTSTRTESLSGIALILGLFTRFFTAAAAIELLVITILYWNNGFS